MNDADSNSDPPTGDRSGKAPIRVLLIGGATLTRAGIRALIERRPGIEIVGDGNSPDEGFDDADAAEPDIVLLDIDDAAASALRLLAQVEEGSRKARILIVATHCDSDECRRLVLAGAAGLVLKDKSPDHLVNAIRKVHEGELWIDRATTAMLISDVANGRRDTPTDPERAKIESLTRRELEVVTLVAIGLNNKAIAARMKISNTTVRHHLTSVFDKLGAHDRLELLIYAVRHKLAPAQT